MVAQVELESKAACAPLLCESILWDKVHAALGVCEQLEGLQSVRVKFLLTDESQAGSAKGVARCASGRWA